MKKNILSADVPPEVAAQVRTVARANRVSRSEVIRQALGEWLERRRLGGRS
jgi:Arc/MetJ-type ribon-helix-helix transcriptional regulator